MRKPTVESGERCLPGDRLHWRPRCRAEECQNRRESRESIGPDVAAREQEPLFETKTQNPAGARVWHLLPRGKLRRRDLVRIGWYLSRMSKDRGYERVVSGHVQVPLHSTKLFRDAGHEVEVITTRFPASHTAPDCLPPTSLCILSKTAGNVRRIPVNPRAAWMGRS